MSGERYINDEDYNCIINLPNDIQDHQVLKEGDIVKIVRKYQDKAQIKKDGVLGWTYLINLRTLND